ncbi:hypothetical protein [Tahibacter amnicola]|uniref:Dicarboxylate transport n=1 Tax=Tahibacter amnicola TaxID=2976241 RepID=A0ABY6BI32_9GAMM|nr:hypothetical protein [Tahibacter amnicola]UXI69668.1 hypothetical protein N4264_08565 [Tahibacter amnicola]
MPALLRTAIGLLALVGITPAIGAAGLALRIERVDAGGIIAEGIDVKLAPATSGGAGLSLQAKARMPGSGGATPVSARCTLMVVDGAWRCEGTAALAATAQSDDGRLTVTVKAGNVDAEVKQAAARLRVQSTAREGARRWQVQLRRFPLARLADAVRARWPEITRLSGELDAEAEAGGAALRGTYAVRDGALDSADGTTAAAGVRLHGAWQWLPGTSWRLTPTLQLEKGEFLHGRFYAAVPEGGIDLRGTIAQRPGGVALDEVHLTDHGAVEIRGKAMFAGAGNAAGWSVDLASATLTFPQAFDRYIKPMATASGWGGLGLRGSVVASGAASDAGVQRWSIQPQSVDLADDAGRLAVRGLDGAVNWHNSGDYDGGSLGWTSAEAYRVSLGPAHWRFRGNDGRFALAGPVSVPLMGGALDVKALSVDRHAARDQRWQATLAVHDIDMGALSRAMGWPVFGGRLGGAVPQVRYDGERLVLDGGLMLHIFDGTLNVTGMALERPFGVAPTLAAEIAFSDLDLALLTGTFDIGEISGRLSGKLAGLRLVDWQPVAFDARMTALGGGTISQRAVKSISSVGGGGFAAGIQASLLRMFDTFGYSRLGIGCALANNVCHMSGLDSSGHGYTLVDGRGLPRIRIVGHQSQVDWPVLVDRLREAMRGHRPIVD